MGRRDLSDERRPQIIEAARRAIARYGIEGATQERIAAEAGMSRQHIRYYLGNREELLDAVWETTMRRYLAGVDTASADAAETGDPRAAIAAFLDESFGYEEDDIVVHSFVGESRRDERIRARTTETYDHVERVAAELARRAVPGRSDEEVALVAHSVTALAMGAMMLDLLDPDAPRGDRLAEVARRLLEGDGSG